MPRGSDKSRSTNNTICCWSAAINISWDVFWRTMDLAQLCQLKPFYLNIVQFSPFLASEDNMCIIFVSDENDQFNLGTGNCPFTKGTYHLSYKKNNASSWHCENTLTSTSSAIVTTSNITFASCPPSTASNSYGKYYLGNICWTCSLSGRGLASGKSEGGLLPVWR